MINDLTQGGNFAILPASIRYDKNLTDSEKLLFCELTALSNKKGFCYAGNKYLAEIFNVTHETISRRINRLKSKGYLHIDIIKEGKEIKERHIYPLMDSSIPIDANVNRGIDANVNRGIDDNVNRGIDANVKENSLYSFNNLKSNKLEREKENNAREGADESEILFAKWWKIYPKKTGSKSKAKQKFIRALKDVGEEQLFKATEIYLKTQEQVQFICGPEVFLNQERYSKENMETYKRIVSEKNSGFNRNNKASFRNSGNEALDNQLDELDEKFENYKMNDDTNLPF